MVRIDHYIHQDSESAILADLQLLKTQIAELGARLMGSLDEQHALLDQINAYTNRLAEAEDKQTATIEEIGKDLDDLIAQTTDTTVKARLESLKARAQAAAEHSEAQSETLKALAAKHDTPLPEPVTPPPAA